MPRTDSNKKLSDANRTADNADGFIDGMLRKLDGGVRNAQEAIKDAVTRRVRDMLVANLAKSGVHRRSGKLEQSVALASVKVNLGRNAKIVISMKDDVDDYSSKEGGGSFYKAAAAVNYGAVHGAKNARKRDKRREKISARKAAKKHGIEGTVSTMSGGRATKAFDFWQLNTTQKTELAEMVGKIFINVVFT